MFVIPVKAETKAPIDITKYDITMLLDALNSKLISSEQLVNIYLERIEKYNDEFNAIIFTNENAIKEAKILDEKRANNELVGALHGIPIIVKANIDVKGIPTTAGAKALANNYPNEDSSLVKKLKDAGAIIIASANMSEFAFNATESYSSYGLVKNAYNLDYSSYGSSGGSAVSVALSFAAAAIGSDTNSSIRVPASAANLVGIRPTYNLIDSTGVINYDYYRDVVGPMTKTVKDSAIIMEVLTDNNYTNNLKDDLKGITIGVPVELYKGSSNANLTVNKKTYEPIYEMIQTKINDMEISGAKIVYIDKFYTSKYYEISKNTLAGGSFCDSFNIYIENTTGPIRSFNDLVRAPGKVTGLGDYLEMCNGYNLTKDPFKNEKQTYRDYIDKIYEDNNIDVIMYPTTKNKLSTINSKNLNSPGSNLTSVIGYASASIPLGFDENLPYGLEFMVKENQENILFEVLSGYEKLNNEITSSPLTPSTYEIEESVEKLNKKYLEYIKREKKDELLITKLEKYYKNYTDNQEASKEAIELELEINNSIKKLDSKTLVEVKEDTNNILKIVLTTIASLLIVTTFIILVIDVNRPKEVLIKIVDSKKRPKKKTTKKKAAPKKKKTIPKKKTSSKKKSTSKKKTTPKTNKRKKKGSKK